MIRLFTENKKVTDVREGRKARRQGKGMKEKEEE